VELTKEHERRPEVRWSDGESSKALRHHADDLERHLVHLDHAANNAGIAREGPGPRAMAENEDVKAARLVI
jgi:hypothetical protein